MLKNKFFYFFVFIFARYLYSGRGRIINDKHKSLIKFIESSRFLFENKNKEVMVNSSDIYFRLSVFYDKFFGKGEKLFFARNSYKKNLDKEIFKKIIEKITVMGNIYEDVIFERSEYFKYEILNNFLYMISKNSDEVYEKHLIF